MHPPEMIIMNLFVKSLALLAFVCLISCMNHNRKSNIGDVVVINDFKNKRLAMSDFIDSVEVYYLESDSFFIGEIGDLCIYDSIMFIIDKLTSNLITYNLKTHSVLSCINKKGNGPYEYIKPQALSVDDSNLYLLDPLSQKIISFNHKLEACNEIGLSFSAFDFIKVKGGFLLCSTLPDPSLDYRKIILLDEDGNQKNAFVHTHRYGMTLGKNFIKQNEDSIFVTIPYSNLMYQWKDNMLHEFYYTDFEGFNIPKDGRMGDLSYYDMDYIHNNNFFVSTSFYINAFLYDSKMHYHFKEKKTEKTYCGIMRDEKNGLPFFPRWQYKDCLIGICRLEEMTEKCRKKMRVQEEGLVALFYKLK